jgi:hypothetical protein
MLNRVIDYVIRFFVFPIQIITYRIIWSRPFEIGFMYQYCNMYH